MFDIAKEESQNSVRMSWNVLPSNPIDLQRYIVPCGIHYTPLKQVDNLQILEYEPLTCKICKSVIAPQFQIDFRSKSWSCPFCESKNMFPTIYAQNISEQNLPAELLPEATTIEYKLNKKESKFPVFMFLIDIAIEESELSELKETIQSTLSLIPPECEIGIITYGTMCNLVELGFTDFPKMFVFKGEKKYSAQNIVTQLGLFNKNDPRIQSQNSKKFLVPLKDSEFAINSFLDDLFPDPFPVGFEERKSNCLGLAINVAISLLESVHNGEPCRIFIFAGGPCNIGSGKIVDLKLKETIRNYLDFEKGNENTYHFQEAIKYYEELADRAFKANQIIDIYSFNKIFESDEEGNLKMCFKGRSELFVTKPLKLKGALGHLVSMNIVNNENNNLKMVSNDYPIGQGNTRVWNLGGIDSTSTYTYILDIDSNNQNNNYRYGIIQFQTSYIASDRTTRLRVTTIKRKISPDLQNNKYEVAQSFDQEAAAVLLAKIAIDKNIKEERNLVLRWIDKTLIKLTSRFAEYNKDEPSSFRLTKEFAYFPQFIFYLRRSFVLKNFNASPDEVTQFKTILLRENVTNGTIMIQPALYSYSGENPESTPVLLEIENMKSDVVLLLDAFFFVCVWYGEDVCKWRDAGFQNEPGYENIKYMLDNPVDYAQSIVSERLPSPRFISADYGTGQERLIKSALDPNLSGSNEFKEGYFITDDVSLKVFMEHLIRKAVAS